MKLRLLYVVLTALFIWPGISQAGNLLRAFEKPLADRKFTYLMMVEAATSKTAPEHIALPTMSIVPHRAIYNMVLNAAKSGSSISDISGKMFFEWADACDGWAVQQHLQMHFVYTEGDESDVNSSVITWEAKDGKQYNFNVRRTTNGKETENYRGRALLTEKGGIGKYSIPREKKEAVLPIDTLFPSSHTTLILQKAAQGEKLFMRRVFDGSDEEGSADISSFIGERINSISQTELTPELRSKPLLAHPAWPIRLAFFKPESETGEPDYEMNLTLQDNGVARYMQIDYGDFSINGILVDVEALPTSCSN